MIWAKFQEFLMLKKLTYQMRNVWDNWNHHFLISGIQSFLTWKNLGICLKPWVFLSTVRSVLSLELQTEDIRIVFSWWNLSVRNLIGFSCHPRAQSKKKSKSFGDFTEHPRRYFFGGTNGLLHTIIFLALIRNFALSYQGCFEFLNFFFCFLTDCHLRGFHPHNR